MAGSIVWRAIDGSVPLEAYSIQVDESNGRASYNGNELLPVRVPLPQRQKAKTTRCRFVRAYLETNPRIVRKFYVATPALWAAIAADSQAQLIAAVYPVADDTSGGATAIWIVTSAKPETYTRRARLVDSGLVDGTPDE